QMSTPSCSHTIAISLTKLMLTNLKAFSISFVTSAASGEDTGTSRSITGSNTRMARSVHTGVRPDDFGCVSNIETTIHWIDPLGCEGHEEILARDQRAAFLENR